jgi:hypothetical protein
LPYAAVHCHGAIAPLWTVVPQTGSEVHPTSYPMGTGALSPGLKWPGREVDQSSPTSAEVKKM